MSISTTILYIYNVYKYYCNLCMVLRGCIVLDYIKEAATLRVDISVPQKATTKIY